jgi:hypothetical protein
MIEEIRAKIANGQFEFSKHAVDQSIIREIVVDEITEAIFSGEVIEKYPNDKYGASCLIFWLYQSQSPATHPMQLSFAGHHQNCYAV